MRKLKMYLIVASIICFTACSNKKTKQFDEQGADESVNATVQSSEIFYSDSPAPPVTLDQGSNQLKLVRMMEGGACKNEQQGAKGVFLVYSDPDDIARIKSAQGSKVFSAFEQEIQNFSLVALNNAVQSIEFEIDPFALDQADAQSKVFVELAKSFRLFIKQDIAEFKQKTTLTIEIIPYQRTFEFYINSCEATHAH